MLQGVGNCRKRSRGLFAFYPTPNSFWIDHTSDSTLATVAWLTAGAYIIGCLFYALKPLRQLSALQKEETERLQGMAEKEQSEGLPPKESA